MEVAQQQHSIWGHLPLLVGSSSKESVEYILQALWRTRRTGLDSADRIIIRDMLHLPDDSHLDPLLLCLRILIRRCVYDNISKDEILKLFPEEVLPELKKLLTLLLQKFQREWREDIQNEQVSLPHLKAMTSDTVNEKEDSNGHVPVVNSKLQSDNQRLSRETEIEFQLGKDALETMLKSMYSTRDHWSNSAQSSKDDAPTGTAQQSEAVGT